MTHQAPPAPAPAGPVAGKPRGTRLVIGLAVVLGIIVVYALSLFGVHLLATSAPPLPEPDLGTTEDTVVQVRLEKLETVANRLTVNVLVIPEDSKFDKRLDVLTQDLAVRLYPENDLGDLQYPVGKTPAQVSTAIEAEGDPANWPFDSYTTGVISADVIVGTGESRVKEPARVEVIGSLDGWDVSVQRVGESSQTTSRPDNVIITLHRAKGSLIFDLGIILVLISLPTLGLWVSIPMALGRKKFLPPFVSWFAAMLFAVVPLRNILPGNPPPGSWIDQAVTLWVLIALIVAMSLFIFAYRRQSD
ncbi:DUF4436 domain-containing protein [Mycobacterium persicum]|uniref:DUF4436 domain-containing protein n=1 Tax=Mycobacterium persicum TaxID=1487726 RepID=A0A1X0LBN3_9MYCO|nr:DUF4436 domain-containing protein [Mycobacterium persicum]KZS84070.1 DUF4436 domain-containing protein [Mycobacterium persicum]ORB59122.1 DUF4436 domain-containing protein [Mycobacterium persicum]ORB90986.1 DUF4436 domain-containing protein [Mycobacterium persicum]ORB94607.1 DUF4436 domain-containing protein [Mycobacterium persicum]ORC01331.1 DUF4436 domain-containing protein [Mycobacterium persicum]